jgi:hypothetical protein
MINAPYLIPAIVTQLSVRKYGSGDQSQSCRVLDEVFLSLRFALALVTVYSGVERQICVTSTGVYS